MTAHVVTGSGTVTLPVAGVPTRAAPVRLVAAAALSAVLAAVASRPWGLGTLALFAYVPAFDAISGARTARSGAGLAALAALGLGSVAYEATVAIGFHVYLLALVLAPLPFAAAGAAAVRFRRAVVWRAACTGGRPVAASGAAVASPPDGRLAALVVLPVLWCAAEWLPAQPRLWGAFAMPLGFIGYSQADLPTLHLATISSVTAVSAVVLAVNASLLVAWRTAAPVQRLVALSVLAALGLLVATVAPNDVAADDQAAVRVRLVQPNLPDSAYLAAASLPATRRALVESLAELAGPSPQAKHADGPVLTLLPEAAWPGPLPTTAGPVGLVAPGLAAVDMPEPLVFGAPSKGDTGFGNSAFLSSAGAVTLVQDKVHLVPIAERGLRAGPGPAVFTAGDVRLAVLICYDAAFPATSRAAAAAGSSMLAILTDDSFAARGDVPRLHVRLAVFRAVETGTPVALASNTGPSVLVDAFGRIAARTPALVATALTAPLPLARRHTTYTELGDWLGICALLAALAIVWVAASRGGGAGSFGSRPT